MSQERNYLYNLGMRRILPAVFLLVLAVACDRGVTGPSETTGTYTLRKVNGSSLPMTLNGTEILSDTIILYVGFTYNKAMRTRPTGQSAVTVTRESGSYSWFGTSITLTSSNGQTQRIGKIDGFDMTFIVDGMTSVFRK